MKKLLKFDTDARKKVAAGAQKLTDAVVATLGPRSRNVILSSNDDYSLPRVLHDGVSIAREIELEDPFEDMGAKLIFSASSKTNDLAGDGTTTATLLANTLLQNGLKLVESGIQDGVIAPKLSPMELQEKLTEYGEIILAKLDAMAKKIETPEATAQIASISAASEELGKLVAEAVSKVGKDGLVMVEESLGADVSSVEFQEGMEFSNGYLSPYFVTDSDRMEVVYSGEHYVLLTDHSIADGMQLVPLIEKLFKEGGKRALLVIADDVVGPALSSLVLTKLRSNFPVVAVMAPEYADRRKQMLEDLAVLTGGVVISREKDMALQDVQINQLGRLSNIKVTATHTALTPLNPDSEEINERAQAIREQIKAEENDFKKSRLQERLAKLTKGVAIIKVGAPSEVELKNKKERVIDAVHATKAALEEGIVPGGGVALRDIANELWKEGKTDDRVLELVVETLRAPIRTILSNAGIENTEEFLNWKVGRGLNVVTKDGIDMIEGGVIDPVKVTKLAVRQAMSVAGIALTTAAVVVNKPKDENNKG